jgi:hypothetical protein
MPDIADEIVKIVMDEVEDHIHASCEEYMEGANEDTIAKEIAIIKSELAWKIRERLRRGGPLSYT